MEDRFVQLLLNHPEYSGLITGPNNHPLLSGSIREIGSHLDPRIKISNEFIAVFRHKLTIFCNLWWTPSGGSYDQFRGNLERILPALAPAMMAEASKVAAKGVQVVSAQVGSYPETPRVQKAVQTLMLYAALEYLIAELLDSSMEVLRRDPVYNPHARYDPDKDEDKRPELLARHLEQALILHPRYAYFTTI